MLVCAPAIHCNPLEALKHHALLRALTRLASHERPHRLHALHLPSHTWLPQKKEHKETCRHLRMFANERFEYLVQLCPCLHSFIWNSTCSQALKVRTLPLAAQKFERKTPTQNLGRTSEMLSCVTWNMCKTCFGGCAECLWSPAMLKQTYRELSSLGLHQRTPLHFSMLELDPFVKMVAICLKARQFHRLWFMQPEINI